MVSLEERTDGLTVAHMRSRLLRTWFKSCYVRSPFCKKKKMDMMISPSGFSAGGGYGYTCTICGGRGVNYKLLNSSKSHNFHGGRDESGLLYSLISSIGLSGGIMRG